MEQEHFEPVRNELETSKGTVKLASRLEARFLAHVDKKGIDWEYEPERIGKAKYYVDFHLPKLGVWVEVKGIMQPIDEIQFPQVARVVKQRDELFFVYQSDNKAFSVTELGLKQITHRELWEQLEQRQSWIPPIQTPTTANREKKKPDVKRPGTELQSSVDNKMIFGVAALAVATIVIVFIAVANRNNFTSMASNSGTATPYKTEIPQLALEPEIVLLSTKTQVPTLQTQTSFTKTPLPALAEMPTIKIVASSLIVRPRPGNRTEAAAELKLGTSATIIGFTIFEIEKTLWWKIQSDEGMIGWIVHNPKFIKVSGVDFDKDIPTNIPKIVP